MVDIIINFLTNERVISILSGVIVYFITNILLSKRKNKIYKQKVERANSELLNCFKPTISAEEDIEIEYYKSISKSLVIKYKIDQKDLYDFETVVNKIVTEIMRSQFLSYDQKKAICDKLLYAKKENKEVQDINKSQAKGLKINSINDKYFAFIIAFFVGVLLAISDKTNTIRFYILRENINQNFVLTIMIFLFFALSFTLSFIKKQIKLKRMGNNNSNEFDILKEIRNIFF